MAENSGDFMNMVEYLDNMKKLSSDLSLATGENLNRLATLLGASLPSAPTPGIFQFAETTEEQLPWYEEQKKKIYPPLEEVLKCSSCENFNNTQCKREVAVSAGRDICINRAIKMEPPKKMSRYDIAKEESHE